MAVLTYPKPILLAHLVSRPKRNTAFVGFTLENNQGEQIKGISWTAIRSDLSDAGVSVSSKTIRSRSADLRPLYRGSTRIFEIYTLSIFYVAAVAEWYRYRTVACLVTCSAPVPQKTRRVGQRCMLNLLRAETCPSGVAVRRGVPGLMSSTSLDHGS
ncbi:hypothetical protein TNCV_5036671 [Trichonephila clavipes]|nr:hypothetical protein TNCV_5036671 [Trichonephila clavipes]